MDVVRRSARDVISRSESSVRAQIAGGRWQLVTPTVVVRHNGPLTRDEQRAAVVLTAGSSSCLVGRTALELQGLTGWESEETHVLIPKGGRPPSFGDLPVVLHESRRPPARVLQRGGLPVCTVARAAVDAASWAVTDRAACGLLAAAIRQRLVRPADLRAELHDATRLARRGLLAGVIEDLAGGAEALSELDFLAFCRRHGFPRPHSQEVRRDRSGRRRYLDVVFSLESGRRVRVEVDGSIHLVELTYWDDMRRGNDLLIANAAALRFPSWAVRTDDPEAVEQLRLALKD